MAEYRIELKRPVCLQGQEFKKGEHAVGQEVWDHWMIQAMLFDGDAVALAEPQQDTEPEAPQEEASQVPDGDAVALAEDAPAAATHRRGRKPKAKK